MADVMTLFRSLVEARSISTFEARSYEVLLNWWKEMIRLAGVGDEGGRIELTPSGQLMVSWNGDPRSRRRLLLVAHADREGYVLCGGDASAGVVYVAPPYHWDPIDPIEMESGREGSTVEFQNVKCHGGRVSGTVGPMHTLDNGAQAAQVKLTEEEVEVLLSEWRGGRPVTCSHTFLGLGGSTNERHGVVEAEAVDNNAGMAVASVVVFEAMLRKRACNVSVLYTVGEESGFLGAIAYIAEDAAQAVSAGWEDTVVVVDASDQRSSRQTPLAKWMRGRFDSKGTRLELDLAGKNVWSEERCPLDGVAVRTEDRLSVLDGDAAQMLYQAGIQARRRIAKDREDVKALWARGHELDLSASHCGLPGAFVGGFCEASVFVHAAEVARALGLENAPRVRVGSVAIPLLNFRMLAGQLVLPEKVAVSALVTAAELLRSACGLYGDYWFHDLSRSGGYRGAAEFRAITGAARFSVGDELAEFWLERWYRRWPDTQKGVREWAEGSGLLGA